MELILIGAAIGLIFVYLYTKAEDFYYDYKFGHMDEDGTISYLNRHLTENKKDCYDGGFRIEKEFRDNEGRLVFKWDNGKITFGDWRKLIDGRLN